jgi:hypothetical protein
MPAVLQRWQYAAIFESQLRLLGLPLVSIRFNGVVGDSRERRAAVGWIAVGDKAYGILFACGPIAVGAISFGAAAVGILPFAGLAIGVLPMGGAAVGWFANGGLAFGMLAFGGCAVAWRAAFGGLAVARDMAFGGLAVAENANNAVAKEFVEHHVFFQFANMLASQGWIWFAMVALIMVLLFWARRIAERASQAGTQ